MMQNKERTLKKKIETNNHKLRKKKTKKENARHPVEACVRTLIINNANQLRKVIFIACKSMKNALLIIVDIMIEVTIHQDCEEKKSFISSNQMKNKKKIKFLNKGHNERVERNSLYKRMQCNTNNSKLKNKN